MAFLSAIHPLLGYAMSHIIIRDTITISGFTPCWHPRESTGSKMPHSISEKELRKQDRRISDKLNVELQRVFDARASVMNTEAHLPSAIHHHHHLVLRLPIDGNNTRGQENRLTTFMFFFPPARLADISYILGKSLARTTLSGTMSNA